MSAYTGFRLVPASMTLNGVTTADARYLCCIEISWASYDDDGGDDDDDDQNYR